MAKLPVMLKNEGNNTCKCCGRKVEGKYVIEVSPRVHYSLEHFQKARKKRK